MPRSDIVGLKKDLFLTFWEFSTLIFWMVALGSIPWIVSEGYLFATILRMMKIFFKIFLSHFYFFFENCLLRSISCFLNGLFVKLYAYWVLYILGINPLPNVQLAKIFPSPCGLSLHLLRYFLSCSAAFGFEVPLVSVGLNYWVKESVQKILPYTWIACCLYFLLAVFQASQCKVKVWV